MAEEEKIICKSKHLVAQAIFGVVLLAAGAWIGNIYEKHKQNIVPVEPIITRQSNPAFPLIKPMVRIDFPSQLNFPELNTLKDKANSFILQHQAAGDAKQISFYFRDTSNAHWVGVGQDDQYHPASLFKVPYLMALYKEAEINPKILEERILYSNAFHNGQDQVQHLENNREYTVNELSRAMIKQSDNDAKDLLIKKMDPQFLVEALNDNGMNLQDISKAMVSPRTYTIFFRTLYNSSFLTSAMSEKALEFLSEVDFKDGLVAGIPTSTKIAHKFGQYADLGDNNIVSSIELHDCGIIYYSNHPYYLCVMTRGYDRDDLANVIRGISSIAFSEFSKIYPPDKK